MIEMASKLQLNIIPLLIYTLLLIATGMTIAISPYVAFFLAGIVFFFIFFFHTTPAVFVYAVYIAFEETVLQYIPVGFYLFVKYSGDLMILTLLLAVFTKLATRKYNLELVKQTPINTPIIIFILLAVLSAFLNDVPLFVAFAGLRQILRYVVLFYLVIIISSAEWNVKIVQRLFSVLFVCVLIQASIGCLQAIFGPDSALNHFLAPGKYFIYEGIPISFGLTGAKMRGSFGTMLIRNTYGVFMMSFSLILLGMLQTIQKKQGRYLFLMLLSIFCVFFSFSRQAMYGFFCGMFAISIIFGNRKLLLTMVIGVMTFLLIFKQYQTKEPVFSEKINIVQRIASPFQASYIKKSLVSDRLYVITNVGPKLLSSKYVFLGLGPAAFGSAVGGGLGYREGYKKLGAEFFAGYSAYISDVGFLSLLGQFGILGLLALVWVFTRLFFSFWRMYKGSDDILFMGIALGSMGLIAGFLITHVGYINLDLRQSSFYFWLLMALTLSFFGKDSAEKFGFTKVKKGQQ